MNWKDFWNKQAAQTTGAPLLQVGRTKDNTPLGEEVMGKILEDVEGLLALQKSHKLLDLCCGNGYLTYRLAQHCAEAVGIDLSEKLIATARQSYSQPNLTYHCADVLELPALSLDTDFDRILLYFSFQYFDSLAKGEIALRNMAELLAPGGFILLGDVPQAEKKWVYYATWRQRYRYFRSLLRGSNPMGKFWGEKELHLIARKAGLAVEKRDQPAYLPYAHYRCDYLLWRM